MYLIVGLGNPGKQYENTRHNVGFDAVDLLVDEYRVPSSGKQHKAMYGKGVIAGQKVILAKPLTYMNLSGESVRALVDYYKIDPEEELIVIYDDISLEPGKIRIRKKGSAGGHNGIKNIIAQHRSILIPHSSDGSIVDPGQILRYLDKSHNKHNLYMPVSIRAML